MTVHVYYLIGFEKKGPLGVQHRFLVADYIKVQLVSFLFVAVAAEIRACEICTVYVHVRLFEPMAHWPIAEIVVMCEVGPFLTYSELVKQIPTLTPGTWVGHGWGF